MPLTRPCSSSRGPPARPGLTIVVMIARSSMYSQNASNGPTKETWPLAPRRSLSLVQVSRKAGAPGRSSPSARRAGAEVAALGPEQREAAVVIEGHALDAERLAVESQHLEGRGADHDVVGGEDGVRRDDDPGAHALLTQDAPEGWLSGISARRETTDAAALRAMEIGESVVDSVRGRAAL